MRRFLLPLLFLLSSPLHAVQIFPNVYTPPVSGGGSTADIIFYHNCDSVTSGNAPTKGAGTVTIGGSYTSVTGQIGNAWKNNNAGNSGGRITVNDSSNITPAEGRIGFWIKTLETGAGADGEIWYVSTSAPKMEWTNVSGTNNMDYKDKTIGGFGGFTTNSWDFVEFAWDSDQDKLGASAKVYLNGVEIGSVSGSAGSDPSGTLKIGSVDGNAFSFEIDQVIVSNNPTRDIYALRNTTSF